MKKLTMKKELQLPEFKDLNFDDFNDFAGGSETGLALRKTLCGAVIQAHVDLDDLWGGLYFFKQYDEARKSLIRECYVELAEAEFMTKSVADDVGRLVLSGVVLTKVLKKIKRLKEDVAKKQKDKDANSWKEWDREDLDKEETK